MSVAKVYMRTPTAPFDPFCVVYDCVVEQTNPREFGQFCIEVFVATVSDENVYLVVGSTPGPVELKMPTVVLHTAFASPSVTE